MTEAAAQSAIAYLASLFPGQGDRFTPENQAALRRRLTGRDGGDVLRAIELHAERSEFISLRGVLECVDLARRERKDNDAAREKMARQRLPAPPPPPPSHRAKVVIAARGVYALTVLDLSEPEPPKGRGRRIMTTAQAEEHFAVMMSEDPAVLADYVHGLEVEMAKRGKGTLASMVNGLGEVVAQ